MAREQVYELDPFAVLVLNLSLGRGWAVRAIHDDDADEARVDLENVETGEWVGNYPTSRLTPLPLELEVG